MTVLPGAWALLFLARTVRGEQKDGTPHRLPAELQNGVSKTWFARMLCRVGVHAWSLASPRYFVCTRCGKTKGMS